MSYQNMTPDELIREIDKLRREIELRKDQGLWNAVAVLEQKIHLARSYLERDKKLIVPGQRYHVEGEEGTFVVHFLKGVMAWGHFEGKEDGEKVAFTIDRLTPLPSSSHRQS